MATRDPLTEREVEILRLLADGLSNGEIAEKLVLTLGTVKWYNNQMFGKLGVKSRVQAVARARELGLLDGAPDVSIAVPLASTPHNLPTHTMPFVGRQEELASILSLLAEPSCRLLTLVGPGGIGKTRLATEAAERQLPAFPDGVFFVSLSPLRAPDDIVPTLANAMGFRFADTGDPRRELLAHLHGRRALLLLDNFDELLAGAGLASDILQAAPGVKILATSRERLNLQEETVYRVEGMRLPDAEAPEMLLENGAIQLFVHSARRVQPDFRADAANLDAVTRICRLVEGMPLGIVLAAAWVELLTPDEIAAEIANSLDFLATQMRNMPERHRSIRGVFESTWHLLADSERAVFARLSVFRGGFTRDAAQAVAGANLQTLMALVNKSLLRRTPDGRYEVHELLRQYAKERLEQSGESQPVCDVHSRYYLDFLGQRRETLEASGQGGALDEIEADMENVRSAWHWAVEQRSGEMIERALESLYLFCIRRSRHWEALRFFDQAIDLAARDPDVLQPRTTLRLYECRGKIRSLTGEFDGAVADLTRVRNAAHALGEDGWERSLLVSLGQLFRKTERHDEARRYLNEVLSASRATGNLRAAADALYHLGTVAWDEGDNIQSGAYHHEAADICRTLGLTDIVAVQAHHGLGESLLYNARPHPAIESFGESLRLARAIGDVGYEAENLQMLGWSTVGIVGTGDNRSAHDYYLQSLAICEAAHLDWHSVCTNIGLGLTHSAQGDYGQGFAAVERGHEVAVALGITRFVSMALDAFGQFYQELNAPERAESFHRQGVELMFRSESTFWLARLQANHAIDRLRQGDLSVGDDLRTAFEIAMSRGQQFHAVRCLEGLAELGIARDEPETALRYADDLLALAEPGDLREMMAQAHRWRGEALLLANQPDAAETELQRALQLATDSGNIRLVCDIHIALAKGYRLRGQPLAADRHQAAARQILARIADKLEDDDARMSLLQGYAAIL